jgi:hypothetical protein
MPCARAGRRPRRRIEANKIPETRRLVTVIDFLHTV